MSKIGRGIMSVFLVLAIFCMAVSATTIYNSECSDGTKYWQCSQTQPGYACLPDSSALDGVSLQNDVVNKIVQKTDGSGEAKCSCSNFAGYIEKNGECVKTTCDYNGQTFKDGQCVNDDPKRCSGGQIVNDASHCGCPVGQSVADDGKTCTLSTGCRWNNPPCSPNQECKYVESNAKDEGHCALKQGCAASIGTVTCTSMQYCDTTTDSNGVCKTKEGCKYSNPACSSDKICDQSTNTCVDKLEVNNADSLQTPDTPTAGAIGSDLSCCCAPAVGIVSLAGLAVFRKRE